jgi:regulator of replication initiation timing
LTLSFFQTPATTAQNPESVSQLQAEIEKLKTTESQLLTEFNRVQGELNSVRQEIAKLESTIAEEELQSSGAITSTLTSDANLFSKPSRGSMVIGHLKKDTLVEICGYEVREQAYKIKFNNAFAYIGEWWVIETPLLSSLRQKETARTVEEENKIKAELEQMKQQQQAAQERQAKIEAKKRVEEAKKQAEAEAARKSSLIKKYGELIGKQIIEKKIWIGMTYEMARESWGKPQEINRTVTALINHEQWVYGSTYLYFENGILTSYQTRR